MKVNKHIKIFTFSFLGFVILCLIIYFSQQKEFKSLITKNGRYTIAMGKEIKKERTGWAFTFKYKVKQKEYDGVIHYGYTGSGGLEVGKIYFVVFNPNNPKKEMLIKYPAVPAKINLDSIPAEGWVELPIQISKDSIKNFLD